MQFTPNTNGAAGFACCHLTNQNNYLGARWNGNAVEVFKKVTGTFTLLASYAAAGGGYGTGQVTQLDTDGATFTIRVNGNILTPTSGSQTITAGPASASTRQGVACRGVINSLDNFQAGKTHETDSMDEIERLYRGQGNPQGPSEALQGLRTLATAPNGGVNKTTWI